MLRVWAAAWIAVLFFGGSLTVLAQQQPMPAGNAVVPTLVQFNGVLSDSNGKPLSSITGVTFSLYAEQVGGAPLWLETQNVQPGKTGHYSVMLGSTRSSGLPSDIFVVGQARWLGVRAEGQQEQPRVMLLSVPYALKAGDAETLGGKPASAFMAAPPGPASQSTPTRTSAYGPSLNTSALTGVGTTNYLPKWTSTSNLGISAVFQSTSGEIGIGTSTPTATLDVNGRTLMTGGSTSNFGLTVSSPTQLGVEIEAPVSNSGAGLNFKTTGTGGKQWQILATGNTSSQGVGKFNIRDVTTNEDVLTVDTLDTVNVGNFAASGFVNTFNLNASVGTFGSYGVVSTGPVGIGSQFNKKVAAANLDVQGNGRDAYIGDPGCGSPFAGIAFGTSGFTNCGNYSLVGDSVNTYVGAPSGNIYFRNNANTSTPMTITAANSVGIGTDTPNAKLDIRGNAGNSGLGIAVDNNAWQAPNASGWIKAMAYIDPFALNGVAVTRCYNSQQVGSAASTPPCGIKLLDHAEGENMIDFGFEVDNRFVTTTVFLTAQSANRYHFTSAGLGSVLNNTGPPFPTSTQVSVLTYYIDTSYGTLGSVDVPFFIIVY